MWCNEEFDKLLQMSVKTTNIKRRKVYYSKAQALISQEIPLLPLAHSKRYQTRSNNVKGSIMPSFGGINFSTVYKSAEGVK